METSVWKSWQTPWLQRIGLAFSMLILSGREDLSLVALLDRLRGDGSASRHAGAMKIPAKQMVPAGASFRLMLQKDFSPAMDKQTFGRSTCIGNVFRKRRPAARQIDNSVETFFLDRGPAPTIKAFVLLFGLVGGQLQHKSLYIYMYHRLHANLGQRQPNEQGWQHIKPKHSQKRRLPGNIP